MSTMNISLPDSLKDFVDEQVIERGYGTHSEYVRELIRRDQDRRALRALLLAGADSPSDSPVDEDYFHAMQRRLLKPAGAAPASRSARSSAAARPRSRTRT